jgi:site-specific DNA recombinase
LITCGHCGLTYSGASWQTKTGAVKSYYTCNGRAQFRGIFGARGEKCPGGSVSGDLEALVWEDIVQFAANTAEVLDELRRERAGDAARISALEREAEALRAEVSTSEAQRDRILALYRRGVIGDDAVAQQLATITREHEEFKTLLGQVEGELRGHAHRDAQVEQAGRTLYRLVRRLDEVDGPLDWATKRALVEELVDRIRIETIERHGITEQVARVTYVFTPIGTRTDKDSWRQ